MSNNFRIAETHAFLKQMEAYELQKYYDRIRTIIYPVLRQNPYYGPNIKRLKGRLKSIYRYRISDYRLFYTIDEDQRLLFILVFAHRKESYR